MKTTLRFSDNFIENIRRREGTKPPREINGELVWGTSSYKEYYIVSNNRFLNGLIPEKLEPTKKKYKYSYFIRLPYDEKTPEEIIKKAIKHQIFRDTINYYASRVSDNDIQIYFNKNRLNFKKIKI